MPRKKSRYYIRLKRTVMTETEIRVRIICAVLTGRTANLDYANLDISTLVSEAIQASAIQASDLILDDLKVRNHLSPQSLSHG